MPFRIQAPINPTLRAVLGVLPFLLLAGVYMHFAAARHRENPQDRLMPIPSKIAAAAGEAWKLRVSGYKEHTVVAGDTRESLAKKYAGDASFADKVRPDEGDLVPGMAVRVPLVERRIATDTKASLARLAAGLGLAAAIALVAGMAMGCFTPVDSTLNWLVTGMSKIPPLAVLPIIFIALGVGEEAKIAIIVFGVAPTLAHDLQLRVRDIPRELITKAYTLGATTLEVAIKVMLPMVMPAFLNGLRLALGSAWVYLIASEAIAAESGLGYRIFVVQRQLGMDTILIYVAWIMVLGSTMDLALRRFISWRYSWSEAR